MLVFLRYTVSGSVMLVGALLMGAHIPRGRELYLTAFWGVITLGIGNGCLAFAEEWVPSGLAALFVATSPFWLVGIEALAPRGERLHLPTVRGMVIGVAGVALLVAPAISGFATNPKVLGAFLLLQLGCAGWAAGSIAQRKTTSKAHPFITGAVQQLATGIVYSVPVMLHPQTVHWNAKGIGAVVYLMIFGSIIGYSAYVFVMDRLPVAVASIYTYVNPVVAVLLGWLAYREPVGWREMAAMAIIFVGVWMVKRASIPSGASVAAGDVGAVEKLGADRTAESGQYGE
jgi:drug/metabolite transporter (DMT)-like permease